MEVELVPDPGEDDPAARAAVAALVREGLVEDERPAGSVGAWRRAGSQAAVERSVTPNGWGQNGFPSHGSAVSGQGMHGSAVSGKAAADAAANGPATTGYVPPGRSSRGATRA